MGATDTRRPGRPPPAGRADRRRRHRDEPLPRRPHPLRDPLEDRSPARLGRPRPRPRPPRPAPTLRDRLPVDLRDAPGPTFTTLPFTSLYQLHDEWAAEIVNRTVHGVMHIGWVPDDTGGHRGQMAVLVKPNGRLGTAYMAAIHPFRHLIIYPPLIRDIEHDWHASAGNPTPAHASA